MMCEISIIVPIFNVEKYLRRCIESILAQTFTDFELILVDDGSTDRCGMICDEYKEKDNRIHVIHQENGGVSKARNAGIEIATGKYITFCDGDDYYDSDLLATYMYAQPENNQWVFGGFKRVAENGAIFTCSSRQKGSWYIKNDREKNGFLQKLLLHDGIGWEVCTALFHEDIIKKNNIRFCTTCENFAEDLGFTLEYLLYCEKVCSLDESKYNYVQHSGSMMSNSNNVIKLNALNEVSVHFGRRYLREFPDMKDEYALLYYLMMQNQYSHMQFNDETLLRIKKCGLNIKNIKWHNYWMRKIRTQFKDLARIYGKKSAVLRIVNVQFLLNNNVLLYKAVCRLLCFLGGRG